MIFHLVILQYDLLISCECGNDRIGIRLQLTGINTDKKKPYTIISSHVILNTNANIAPVFHIL